MKWVHMTGFERVDLPLMGKGKQHQHLSRKKPNQNKTKWWGLCFVYVGD